MSSLTAKNCLLFWELYMRDQSIINLGVPTTLVPGFRDDKLLFSGRLAFGPNHLTNAMIYCHPSIVGNGRRRDTSGESLVAVFNLYKSLYAMSVALRN